MVFRSYQYIGSDYEQASTMPRTSKQQSNKRTTELVVNEDETLRLTMVWCGLEQEPEFRAKSRECMERLVPCFETEEAATTILMTECFHDSIHSSRFAPEEIAGFGLPGTTCAVLVVQKNINAQTRRNLNSFGAQLKNRNGPNWVMRVIIVGAE